MDVGDRASSSECSFLIKLSSRRPYVPLQRGSLANDPVRSVPRPNVLLERVRPEPARRAGQFRPYAHDFGSQIAHLCDLQRVLPPNQIHVLCLFHVLRVRLCWRFRAASPYPCRQSLFHYEIDP